MLGKACAQERGGTPIAVSVCRLVGLRTPALRDRYGLQANVLAPAKRKSGVPNGSAGTQNSANAVSTNNAQTEKRAAPNPNGLPPNASVYRPVRTVKDVPRPKSGTPQSAPAPALVKKHAAAASPGTTKNANVS